MNMKITIKVKLRSKVAKVQKMDDGYFLVSVNALPKEGEANRAIIKALARYFEVAPSRVSIVSGQMSRTKIIEILR